MSTFCRQFVFKYLHFRDFYYLSIEYNNMSSCTMHGGKRTHKKRGGKKRGGMSCTRGKKTRGRTHKRRGGKKTLLQRLGF